LGCFVLLSLPTAAFAADEPATPKAVLASTAATAPIERIQVRASRALPSDYAYIRVGDLTPQLAKPAELLLQLPGLAYSGQGGQFQSYSIRGMSRQRIRTDVAGVPIFTERRAGNSVSFLPPALLGEIVVHKGPQGTLYGQDAMGGVISLQPSLPLGRRLVFGSAVNGMDQQWVLTDADASQQWALVRRQQGVGKAANGFLLQDAFQQDAAFGARSWALPDIDIHAFSVVSHGRDIGKSSRKHPREQTIYPDEYHLLSQLRVHAHAGWQWQLYQHYQHWDSRMTSYSATDRQVPTQQVDTTYQAHTLGSLLQQPWQGQQWQGQWGLEWVGRYGVRSREQQWQQRASDVLAAAQTNIAIFHEWLFDWGPWQWNFGARLDQLQQQSDLPQSDLAWPQSAAGLATDASLTQRRFSGHLAVERTWLSRWRWSYRMADGFRFASLSERFFVGVTPRGTVIGNKALRPEHIFGHNLALNYQAERWQWGLQLYHYQVDDYIERYRLAPTVRSYRNEDRAELTGLEVETQWQWTPWLTSKTSAHVQRGRDQAGQPLADQSPAHLIQQWLLHYQQHQWQLNARYYHPHTRPALDETMLPRALVWQLEYRYSLNAQWLLQFGIDNLTNKLYQASTDIDATWERGRQWRLSVQWQINN
jgi:iron complex outermembrane receptor protein